MVFSADCRLGIDCCRVALTYPSVAKLEETFWVMLADWICELTASI